MDMNDFETLKKSTMFHMSLGSKELFHSNFLHWISIVNWDAFLGVMHGLAGVEKFWWESVNDFNNKMYCPINCNVKVFREHRNFDLSIYILYSEKEAKDNNKSYIVAEDDNSLEFFQDTEGKRMIQKWLPVLVLENKMKSLPYFEQLEGYTQKAFEEWANIINEKAQKSPNKELSVTGNNQYSITFILLSLKQTMLNQYEFENKKEGKRPHFTLKLKSTWKHQTYNKLLDQLRKVVFPKDLDKLILKDYCNFVEALCGLANQWSISPEMIYRSHIYPWNINTPNADANRKEIDKYKELRIHDIHEKLLYNQLLQMLEAELDKCNIKFKRYNRKTFKDDTQKCKIKIFTNPNYAHGVGIVEAFFVIKSNFKLFIQVQGDRYCHMVVIDKNKIVLQEKDANGRKTLSVNTKKIPSNILKDGMLNNYISINNSNPIFPWNVQSPSWGHYGDNNIYQYVLIPSNIKIKDVIKAIVDDIIKINKWF